MNNLDLFREAHAIEQIAVDSYVLRGFAQPVSAALLQALQAILIQAPLRHFITKSGKHFSVQSTSCGVLGWCSTQKHGYDYTAYDPDTVAPWPAMPSVFHELAQRASHKVGFTNFDPDSCLINYYKSGSKMGLHQDRDERDYSQPIVSVSLGLSALFLWGGTTRHQPVLHLPLHHADVMVWGGRDRLRFHGVSTLYPSPDPLNTNTRINLTFRKAG